MNAIAALTRASWQTTTSYRFRLMMSIGALAFTVVPLYFVSGAVQPVMADAIRDQGGEAFGFLLVGLATFSLVSNAVNSLPGSLSGGIRTGTLEAMMSTPAPLVHLLTGMSAFGFLWTSVRVVILVLAGWVLGADIVWTGLLPGVAVVGLIVLAHLPFGLMAGAMILVFRTAAPLPKIVLGVSSLLGGVYYPTDVVPSWLQLISNVLPLTYGLRALRALVLEGEGLFAVLGDVAVLAAMTALLLTAGLVIFTAALDYARRRGTLAQY